MRPAIRTALCMLPALLLPASPADARKAPDRLRAVGLSTQPAWRQVATALDRDRLRGWRQAWIDALARVRAGPDAASLAADPLLYDPDRALPDATLPPGDYRCRISKLGANGAAVRDVTRYPAVDCQVGADGKTSSLYLATGSQRPVGRIFPDTPARAIFLGTLVLGDETTPLRYGLDDGRDLIGYVERIEPMRWRLVMPRPRFEALVEVIELVPAR